MLDEMEAEADAMAAELARKSSGDISSSETSKYTEGVFCWPVPCQQQNNIGMMVTECARSMVCLIASCHRHRGTKRQCRTGRQQRKGNFILIQTKLR